MAKRRKMSRKGSKKYFSKTASKTHKFNMAGSGSGYTMRGGIRL